MNHKLSVAIHQPNFMPWTGYFLKISVCDIFVFLDDVQFSRQRGARTKIKSKMGEELTLSFPVNLKNGVQTTYAEAMPVSDTTIRKKLLNKIRENYLHTPYFKQIYPIIEKHFLFKSDSLSMLNSSLIIDLAALLGIKTCFIFASELSMSKMDKNTRNLEICQKLNGQIYWSGTGALNYNHPAIFEQHQILLRYADIKKEMLDLISPQELNLSVIHHLFMIGPENLAHEIQRLSRGVI